MEFKVSELEREPIDFDLQLTPGAVDFGEEAEQVGDLATSGLAEVLHEHRGPRDIVADIRLRGRFSGKFQVPCARCVEPVEIPLEADFDLIFRPAEADSEAPERSITAPETEIGYYQGDSLLLEDVLREQVLLSLPVRTLCKPDCKGLCPRCGENRNTQKCNCDEGPATPAGKRWLGSAAGSSPENSTPEIEGVPPERPLGRGLIAARSCTGFETAGDTKGIESCLIRKGATRRAAPHYAALTIF
jgi:uncharacterized protein